jgi:hypothetical protein
MISVRIFECTIGIRSNICLEQLFNGNPVAMKNFVDSQVIKLLELRNAFSWHTENPKSKSSKSVDEFTVFQPLFKCYLNQLFESLNPASVDEYVVDGNFENLSLQVYLKEENVYSIISGSTDLIVRRPQNMSMSSFDRLVELKPPFSSHRGMYRTRAHKPRDQLVLQLQSVVQNVNRSALGILTDCFSICVDFCLFDESSSMVTHFMSSTS